MSILFYNILWCHSFFDLRTLLFTWLNVGFRHVQSAPIAFYYDVQEYHWIVDPIHSCTRNKNFIEKLLQIMPISPYPSNRTNLQFRELWRFWLTDRSYHDRGKMVLFGRSLKPTCIQVTTYQESNHKTKHKHLFSQNILWWCW